MIKELFLQAIERDMPESYLTNWSLQFEQETKDNQIFDFKDFKGEDDLVKWIRWCGDNPVLCYLPLSVIDKWERESLANDIIAGNKTDYRTQLDSSILTRIGTSNAIDYVIPQMFKKNIYNVLDFGAGYGRQANLWSDGIYVGMDACLNSYCVQNLYYKSLGKPFVEYMDDSFKGEYPKTFRGIIHLPTWKSFAIENNFFDMVMCVQVLRELSTELVQKMLTEFHRVLKVGGIIYIRDHDIKWMPCTQISIHDFLINLGFEKGKTDDPNWKEDIKDGIDLHGVPRIYVKK